MTNEKTKVLIVDDIAETRENIRKLLQFETSVDVVGAARTGKEAIELVSELQPHVVLMDINMPDMDGIVATEAIRQKLPWTQIVVLSVQSDANYMRRAMLAGARDFLTKPPSIDDLISAIRRAGAMAAEEKEKVSAGGMPFMPSQGQKMGMPSVFANEGSVITVYSPKGGTGCSTVAANLAISLQNDDSQVIIVDGNLQFGDTAIFFNEQGKNHIGDLTVRVDELDPEVVEEVVITHSPSGVKILASPPRPELADEITDDQFLKLLEYLRKLYAYVIIDTSTDLNDMTLAALENAEMVILITTQDIPSIANSRTFLDVSRALGLPPDNIVFIMNRYDKRINITPEKIGENFKKEIEAIIPLDSRTVIPSVNRGVPFMLDSKNRSQPAGRALLSLAEIVRTKVSQLSVIQ
jgi:pilus assembly protein CpaE